MQEYLDDDEVVDRRRMESHRRETDKRIAIMERGLLDLSEHFNTMLGRIDGGILVAKMSLGIIMAGVIFFSSSVLWYMDKRDSIIDKTQQELYKISQDVEACKRNLRALP